MKNKQALKVFLILLISTAYIFSFSKFGVLAYEAFMNDDDYFLEGTKIASVSVEGKTKNEAMKLLDERLTKWLDETTITLKYKEKEETLNLLDCFNFDIETSVSKAKQSVSNPAVVKVNSLDSALNNISKTLLEDKLLDMDKLNSKLLEIAQMLTIGNYQIKLEDFLKDTSPIKSVAIQEATMDFGSSIQEIEPFLNKSIEIKGQSQFSFINFLKDEHLESLSSSLLSKMATSIYEVILPTNFSIIERHISNELPDYAELGFEAKVNPNKNIDLVFANPNETSYTIEFIKKGNSVKTVLKGSELLNEYKIITSGQQTFKPRTIKQYNPLLNPSQIEVKAEGKEGLLIKVNREIYDENGMLVKKELISEDFYPPIHRVEVSGLKPSNEEETNENTDQTSDGSSELSGQEQEVQKQESEQNEKQATDKKDKGEQTKKSNQDSKKSEQSKKSNQGREKGDQSKK